MQKITAKQEKFCHEYLIDCNGQQAAIRAGYSPKAAKVEGSRLLTNANVKARLAELQQEVNKSIKVTAQDVINELAKLALFNIRDLMDENDNMKKIHELTPEQSAAISEITVTTQRLGKEITNTSIKVKMHSKTQALDMLGKHFGIYAPVEMDLNLNDVSKTPFKLRTRKD